MADAQIQQQNGQEDQLVVVSNNGVNLNFSPALQQNLLVSGSGKTDENGDGDPDTNKNDSSPQQPLVNLVNLIVVPGGDGDDNDDENNNNAPPPAPRPPDQDAFRRHPCYSFGLSRKQGAKCWTVLNLIPAMLDFSLALFNLLITLEMIAEPKGYSTYFQLFHALECSNFVMIDIMLVFGGSVLNTLAAILFFLAANLLSNKTARISLSVAYACLVLLPVLLLLPRIAMAFLSKSGDHSVGGSCVLEGRGNTELNFWIVNAMLIVAMSVWSVYGVMVADAFVRWLKMSEKEQQIEEIKHDNDLLDDDI